MASEIVVYTRPGCPYSARLRFALRRRRVPYRTIDISRDVAAAAEVRAHADGNETVPTVVVAGRWLVNPSADQVCAAAGITARPPAFRMTRWRRVADSLVMLFARAGIGPMYVLATRGRRTGQIRTLPVVPVDRDGQRFLVAPYGPVAWVHNVRASGRAALRRGRFARDYAVAEVSAEQAGPVLKQYVAIASAARHSFAAAPDAPVQAFVAEAHQHPVFRLS
jgi:deazaflavin-dependent oxidoreductase (nitroreductase family)